MGIGDRNRFISIYKRSTAVNAANEATGWTLYKQCWANIKAQSGLGVVRGMVEGVEGDVARYSVRVAYDPMLDAAMRVVNSEGVSFNVIDARHDFGGRLYTDLIVELGGSNG